MKLSGLKTSLLTAVLLFFIAASSLLFLSCTDSTTDSTVENDAAAAAGFREQSGDGQAEPALPADSEPEKEAPPPYQGKICNNLEIIPEPELPRVGLYSGSGSWNENVEVIEHFLDYYGFTWSVFDEEDAVNLNFKERFDLLWFPGGFAAEYKNYISDHSNIRSFIHEGGSFVGSCAGAYYAGHILRWHGTDYQYPLHLFEGKGTGPLSGLIGWGETGAIVLEKNHPANRSFEPVMEMYYFDGPYFEPADPGSITVLARYEVNDEPAVIAGKSGDGKFLLMGPHPEIGGYSEQSPQFSLDGGEGAQWPWLYAVLHWFSGF